MKIISSLCVLSTLIFIGAASVEEPKPEQKLVSTPVMYNKIAFSRAANFTIPAPTISSFYAGNVGNQMRTVALDLNQKETHIFAEICPDCLPDSQHIRPTPDGQQSSLEAKPFSYRFHDGAVNGLAMRNWNDNVCVNDFCVWWFSYWVLDNSTSLSVQEQGVLGLAPNTATSSLYYSMWLHFYGDRDVISLTLGDTEDESAFTIGGIDPRFYAPCTKTRIANSTSPDAWTFTMGQIALWFDGTYGGTTTDPIEVSLNLESLLYEIPFREFDYITNNWIDRYPNFVRDHNLQAHAPGPCPTDGWSLNFYIQSSNYTDENLDYLNIIIPPERFLHFEENVCSMLIVPSKDHKFRMGASVFEEYIVSFNNDKMTIGFTKKDLQQEAFPLAQEPKFLI